MLPNSSHAPVLFLFSPTLVRDPLAFFRLRLFRRFAGFCLAEASPCAMLTFFFSDASLGLLSVSVVSIGIVELLGSVSGDLTASSPREVAKGA